MKGSQLTKAAHAAIRREMRRLNLLAGLLVVPVTLGGCVSVEAPTEPIVINLNINIRQEVVYQLNDDAQQLIEEESEIF